MFINKYGPEYEHAEMRVLGAVRKATKNGVYNKEKFINAMFLRLRKMKSNANALNQEKVNYTIAVLKDLIAREIGTEDVKGFQYVLDMYEGRLTLEVLENGKSSLY